MSKFTYELMAGGRRLAGAKIAGIKFIPAIIRRIDANGDLTTIQKNVDISSIDVGTRFRKDYGDMEDFVESIHEKGIIQPITLRNIDDTKENDDEYAERDLREIELFENVFRKEMEWHEKIALVDKIQKIWTIKNEKTPWKWSKRKCAKMLDISHTHINRQLDLAKAVEMIPTLKECKTEDDARKRLKKLQEKVIVNRAVKEQKAERAKSTGNSIVDIADANYHIADCLVAMKETVAYYKKNKTTSTISFIEVDPPYGIDLQASKRRVGEDALDIEEYNEVDKKDYNAFLKETCDLCYDMVANDAFIVFWFGPTWFTEVKQALVTAGWKVDDIPAIWVKPKGQTNAPSIYMARAYEPFFIARKGNPTLYRKGRNNVFNYSPPSAKYHPTQRPITLMDDIYQTFAYPGSNCLVPFAGSGVSLQAAYRNYCTVTGYDLSKEYKKRFLLEIEQDEMLQE